MATKTIVVDDMDGDDRDVISHQFSVDDQVYEIDLSGQNFTGLQLALEPYISVARPKKKSLRNRTRIDPMENGSRREVRVWARANGFEIGNKGRVPEDVVQAYEAAHAANGVRT